MVKSGISEFSTKNNFCPDASGTPLESMKANKSQQMSNKADGTFCDHKYVNQRPWKPFTSVSSVGG